LITSNGNKVIILIKVTADTFLQTLTYLTISLSKAIRHEVTAKKLILKVLEYPKQNKAPDKRMIKWVDISATP
jgi:hypothetical protein